MASIPDGGRPRWWRRTRDEALRDARSAAEAAAGTAERFEVLEADLNELVALHALAASEGDEEAALGDPLQTEWDAIYVRTSTALLQYYELAAGYVPTVDYEEGEARRFATGFASSSAALEALSPEVETFRSRHDRALSAAAELRDGVPAVIEEADTLQREALRMLTAASAKQLTDPVAWAAHRTATGHLETARARAEERKWYAAHRAASAARDAAEDAADRGRRIEESATQLRNGFMSVRTRRDGLQTQHDRLEPVMSELRKRYSYGAWKAIEHAPEQIGAAMKAVDDGLVRLESVLATTPLDVDTGTTTLGSVRAAASQVDSILRSATDLLDRLDAITSDPEVLVGPVRRKCHDARLFLTGLKPDQQRRYASTYDSLALRTDKLASAARQPRPDWGALMSEAETILAALDSMINAARGR